MQELLGNIALWPAQQVLAGILASDAHIRKSLNQFAGKALQISASRPSFNLCLIFDEDSVRINALDASRHALPVDAVIRASAQELLALLFDKSSGSLVASGIEIDGDVQFTQDLFTTLKRLDLDWQDYLAPLVGDMPAHELGRLSEKSRGWARETRENIHRNVDDYLKEEIRLFPHRHELRNFDAGVDELRLRIDRLQARAEALASRLGD